MTNNAFEATPSSFAFISDRRVIDGETHNNQSALCLLATGWYYRVDTSLSFVSEYKVYTENIYRERGLWIERRHVIGG